MYNNDFYILHLSDLHIKNTGTKKGNSSTYSTALKNLINDIDKQTKDKQNIILVISGDIIDQGRYDLHKDAAIKFFKKLQVVLDNKVESIIVVPGNHDKTRTKVNSLIARSHCELDLCFKDNADCEDEWQVYKDAYSGYFSLVAEIHKIFGKDYEDNNSFFVKKVQIDGKNICFVGIDTAWCSHSKNDNRILRIGDYQLKKLVEEYNDIKAELESVDESIDLTIAVSHFPMNWLREEEEKKINEYFLSEDFLNVDILLCGHVHDFSVVNYFNHNHSLLTLVTGIGWGANEPSEEKVKNHRYSIYTLNMFYNSCDILMRKTKSDGTFDYDYSLYAGEHEVSDCKLRYPLKVKESNAYIRVNSESSLNTKSLFIDKSLLERIPYVSKSISLFSTNISGVYNRYKESIIKALVAKKFPNYDESILSESSFSDEQLENYNKTINDLTDYFYENKKLNTGLEELLVSVDRIKDFNGFLNEICTSVVDEMEDCFSNEVGIRAHFRWHDDSDGSDEYPMLCQYSNLPESEKRESMQVVKWGGLIKPAFDTKEAMVFSANKNSNTIHTDWTDFITMIPEFTNYSHDIRKGKRQIEHRPTLTFGISIKNLVEKKDHLILYILAFLRFDHILTAIIDDYMRLFRINADDFLEEIKRIKNIEA